MEHAIKAGFIGCGNMGGVLASVAAKALGLSGSAASPMCETSPKKAEAPLTGAVLLSDHNVDKMNALRSAYGCTVSSTEEIAKTCDVIFLGVKPQTMGKACSEIRDMLSLRLMNGERVFVVTMAAGLSLSAYEEMLPACPMIRMMPNTPCSVGEGVILYSSSERVTAADVSLFCKLMAPSGVLLPIAEEKIDAASALSGCGPAFVYVFLDALIDGGVRAGLPPARAKELAVQTVLGSALLARETGEEPTKLKRAVCSPAGSTIEGVSLLEARSVHSAVMDAVYASYLRTKELGR